MWRMCQRFVSFHPNEHCIRFLVSSLNLLSVYLLQYNQTNANDDLWYLTVEHLNGCLNGQERLIFDLRLHVGPSLSCDQSDFWLVSSNNSLCHECIEFCILWFQMAYVSRWPRDSWRNGSLCHKFSRNVELQELEQVIGLSRSRNK